MCSVCKSFKCHPSCPNAPEPKRYAVCKMCHEDILDGEEMVEIEGKKYHLDCLSASDVLDLLEIPITVAGEGIYG